MQTQTFTTTLADKTLTAEFSDLTEQANGSVLLKYGETTILVTAVMSDREHSGAQYFPLSVEFEEKFFAAGKILGSRFMRREGRPSEEAILSARIIDRTIRPLFSQYIRNDIQIVVNVLALGEEDPDVLGVIGTSLALSVSDIPWTGPVGAVRIARNKISQKLVLNPNYQERETGLLDFEIFACGKDNTINMIETAAAEISEADVTAALHAATSAHQALEAWQKEIVTTIGKPKQPTPTLTVPEEITALLKTDFAEQLSNALFSATAGKEHINELKNKFIDAAVVAQLDATLADQYFETQIDKLLHLGALKEGKRADGRGLDEVRDLYAQAGGISPVLHGSGIFYRGGTHIFSALTLGGPESALSIDSIEEQDLKKRFMHHYNFPPFSVGETGRVGGFNRRMIGHGALAEKALLPVIPAQKAFPYTIRLVSETLSSNGSSSMGSVCASTLALLDGGVPLKRPVAGIASGVMMEGEKYTLLTDIQGPEDEFGDMDLKVAGTTEGITAIQMDVKVSGMSIQILTEALEKARLARLHILETMSQTIAAPRAAISDRVPQIVVLRILPEQIGLVVGSGGKTINAIKADTGVDEITIEEDGAVFISGKNNTTALAKERIEQLTKTYQVGDTVQATITKLVPFGAFARLDPYHEGLIHISEVAPFHIETVDNLLSVGDVMQVAVSKVENGKIGLSIKQVDPDFAKNKGVAPSHN